MSNSKNIDKKRILTRAVALGSAVGIVTGMGLLFNSNESKARTRVSRCSMQTKPSSSENFTTKRPSVNTSKPINTQTEHNSKDYISPSASYYDSDTKSKKSSNKRTPRKVRTSSQSTRNSRTVR